MISIRDGANGGRSPWRSRTRRWVVRLLFYASVVFVVLPIVFSFLLTSAHPREVTSSPAAGYEEVHFVSDELKLKGWLAKGHADLPALVIVHGLGDSLESYVEHGQPFVTREHTVLLIDLRGHGGSEGRITTLGSRESSDVRAAMQFLREGGLAEAGIVLMGTSMGAVAVLLAAANETNVRAVIAEAPFDSYRNTVAHHAWLLYGMPSWVPLIPITIRIAEWRGDFDADDVDAVAATARIEAPLLAIVDGNDRRMPERVVRRIVDAHPGSNDLWIADGVGHAGAILHTDWERTVIRFLEANGVETGAR